MIRPAEKKDIAAIFEAGKPIDDAVNRAVEDALLDHKRAGNPVCVWRDGQVVWVAPEDIPVEDPLRK
jgi:isoaspartyl peptidase/L-asparaginase-like protein (Ntn-hydrolase superfamily)